MSAAIQATGDAPMTTPLFELRGISKEFPGVKALDDVSLRRVAGRSAHAGRRERRRQIDPDENVVRRLSRRRRRILLQRRDGGDLRPPPTPENSASPSSSRNSRSSPISTSRRTSFSAANFRAAARDHRPAPDLARGQARARQHRIRHRSAMPVHRLGVAQQQMVEIAKALSQNARILVMDEPTAALSDRETERLFAMIARLKADGVAIIYISHRLSEVFALGDRITVLRDGRKHRRGPAAGDDAGSARDADGRPRRRYELSAAIAADARRSGARGQESLTAAKRLFRHQS